MGLKKTFTNYKPAFTGDLWKLDMTNLSKARQRFFRFMKLTRFTFNEFAEQRMGFQCVALSYFVALAIIPLVAFIFSVTDGLGLSDKIATVLYSYTANLNIGKEVVDMVIDKAGNIINVAQNGWVGVISFLMFIWTILWMMFQTERVFNNVWGMRKFGRKIYKRFSVYIIMLLLLPFIILIFGAGIALYTNATTVIGLDFKEFAFLKTLLTWVVFYIFSVLVISAMYKWIPAVKVRYKYAFKSALLSAAVFAGFQYLYLETQVFVGRLNGVYGVLAAIPLFLIWMNFSWQIIMYGALLCRAYHQADTYNAQ